MRAAATVEREAPPALDEPSDGRLVAAVARGDAAAFRTLVDRHNAAVHRLAWRMLGQASEAEDVTQDAFLRLWTHAASWRPGQGGGALAWLRRVATNLCLDRLRRRKFVSDASPPDRADEGRGADEALNMQRLSALTGAAVNALPERQKAAIVLTYYEALPNAVAAETMEMNLKAFESLLLRARAALRQALAGAGVSAADLGSAR